MAKNSISKTRVDDYFEKLEKSVSDNQDMHVDSKTKANKKAEYKSVNFIWLDGNQHAFNFSYMTDIAFDIGIEGQNHITINFSHMQVVLKGYRLLDLYQDLQNHHVNIIYQEDSRYQMNDTDYVPIVTDIEIVSSS